MPRAHTHVGLRFGWLVYWTAVILVPVQLGYPGLRGARCRAHTLPQLDASQLPVTVAVWIRGYVGCAHTVCHAFTLHVYVHGYVGCSYAHRYTRLQVAILLVDFVSWFGIALPRALRLRALITQLRFTRVHVCPFAGYVYVYGRHVYVTHTGTVVDALCSFFAARTIRFPLRCTAHVYVYLLVSVDLRCTRVYTALFVCCYGHVLRYVAFTLHTVARYTHALRFCLRFGLRCRTLPTFTRLLWCCCTLFGPRVTHLPLER